MPENRTRYILQPLKDGKTGLLVSHEVPLKGGKTFRRRTPLGSFHTRNGAKAYARIHAGSAPIIFLVAA